MADYNLADISFFNSINDSASRTFVWNGTHALVMPIVNKNTDSKDAGRLRKFFKKIKQEQTVDPVKGGSGAAELRDSSIKATGNKFKKALRTAAIGIPLLAPIGGTIETGMSHLLQPQVAQERWEEQSGFENLRDLTLYNDLYQQCLSDSGMLRFFEFVRRMVEFGFAGDMLSKALAAGIEHMKNKKNAKSGKQHYSKGTNSVTGDEYNLAADLTDQFEQEKALMQNSHAQDVMAMQKTIERLQDQIAVMQKSLSFRD